MQGTEEYVNERLDHLGIVAGVCREIGLAEWLDAQEPGNRQQVSVGTATTAMLLNGLGFSNRQLYLVSQFFANKPVEHLLGPGISAELLNDDCLGRTLDWLYEHDLTKLFAGIASRARRIFGIKAEQIHVDTTSFSVSGEYTREITETTRAEAAVIAITYGYSRDHREDLKQWMLALATTHEGDIPLFMQPLDGNSSDKVSLLLTPMYNWLCPRDAQRDGRWDIDVFASCISSARRSMNVPAVVAFQHPSRAQTPPRSARSRLSADDPLRPIHRPTLPG